MEKKFENFVAFELKARIDLWNDYLPDRFNIFFIRTRDKKETDFLITKNQKPFLMFEAKLLSEEIEKHHYLHSRYLGNIPFIQIVKKENVLKVKDTNFYIISASRFFV
jgi:predicted AAA+ superfamily ATPase